MVRVTANKNGEKVFIFDIIWTMSGRLSVQADTEEEAIKYIEEHEDELPLDTDGDYAGGYGVLYGYVEELEIGSEGD